MYFQLQYPKIHYTPCRTHINYNIIIQFMCSGFFKLNFHFCDLLLFLGFIIYYYYPNPLGRWLRYFLLQSFFGVPIRRWNLPLFGKNGQNSKITPVNFLVITFIKNTIMIYTNWIDVCDHFDYNLFWYTDRKAKSGFFGNFCPFLTKMGTKII